MQRVVLEGTMEFSLINSRFLYHLTREILTYLLFANQLFKVSIVNFSSTENSTANELDFYRARTAVAASFS